MGLFLTTLLLFKVIQAPDLSDDAYIGSTSATHLLRIPSARIEEEFFGSKRIVHNYGFGASALTLCWSAAEEAAKLIPPSTVAVLGSGPIALATAYELLERGCRVHLYCGELETCFFGSLGCGSKCRFLNEEFPGVEKMNKYFFNSLEPVYFTLSLSSPRMEQIPFDSGVTHKGWKVPQIHIDPPRFLSALRSELLERGAVLAPLPNSIEEILALSEEVIVNCIESSNPFNDPNLVPETVSLHHFRSEGRCFLQSKMSLAPERWFFVSPWGGHLVIGQIGESGEEELLTVVNSFFYPTL